MKLALAQMSNAGSIESNLAKSVKIIESAAAQGAHMVLFPEVQLTEFFPQYPGCDVSTYWVGIDSHEVQTLRSACRACGIMAVPNVYLKESGKAYDASILISNSGEVVGVQKMVHVAQAPQFYEQDYYMPADDGFKVFDTPWGRVGVVVCFDRHYPESIRTEALRGADLILIPTANTKDEPSEMFEWELRVQAFHNSVAIAMCNRVGNEDAMDFSGASIVVDASGNVLCKADGTEQILYADLDLTESAKIRQEKPYTSLRRPEWY